MSVTVKINFTSGHVGGMSLPDGVSDATIQAAVDKALISWSKPAALEAAWLPITSWARVDPSAFPDDRTFRNAWRHAGNAVVVDLPEAKKITADKLKLPVDDPTIIAATTEEALKALLDGDKLKKAAKP